MPSSPKTCFAKEDAGSATEEDINDPDCGRTSRGRGIKKQSDHYVLYWPWKMLWRTKAPIKVVCFGWVVIREACLTRDNLQRRSFVLSNKCYLCEEDIKSLMDSWQGQKIAKFQKQLWRTIPLCITW